MPTLLITGGTGEIGCAIVKKFIAKDYQIIAPSRNELNLMDENKIHTFLVDVQKIDAFIHCAGFNEPKKIENIDSADLKKTMQINALSFYDIMHDLLVQGKINSNGHILGVSSIYGFLARKGRFSYVASKHCLYGMIKTLALELGEKNIKSNVISPGFVDTQMTRKNNSEEMIKGFEKKIPLGRLASVEDIAQVAYFLCSPENSYINGQEIIVDGGYSIGGFES